MSEKLLKAVSSVENELLVSVILRRLLFMGFINSENNPTGAGTITNSDGTAYHCDFNNGQLKTSSIVTIISTNGYKYVSSGEMALSRE